MMFTPPGNRVSRNLLTGAVLCAATLIFVSGCTGVNGGPGSASSVKGVAVKPIRSETEARKAFYLVNEERIKRGMVPLTRDPDLDAVAMDHARDLMRMNRLSHTSSDGKMLENRLKHLEWDWAGENLARNKGFESASAEAVRGWIASPKHYEIMFRPDFSQTGMAAILDPDTGFTYFVQVFIIPVS